LNTVEHVVENSTPREGLLFPIPAYDLKEQREERKITITERCEMATEIALKHKGQTVLWCHLNQEGDLLTKLIPDAVQVAGHMADEKKEERLLGFQRGEIKNLVIKPKIGCWGLNWQNCHNIVTFPSHSWEQYYQAVRRCWRFGQKKPVTVNIITTEGEQRVLHNLQRKAGQAEKMFESLVGYMNDSMKIDHELQFKEKESLPSWLGGRNGSH
jgi:hypothetical protein